MSDGALRILLVDDHALLREGLRLLLSRMPGVASVDEAGSCPAALDQMAACPRDLLLMDLHMPGIDGIEGTRRVLARHPEVKIIILSGDAEGPVILDALRAGARAYVIKENSSEEIGRAIHAVIDGKGYLSPEVAGALARHCREAPLAPAPAAPQLSPQEKRLLLLVSQGKRNKEIAAELDVATKSVEAYRSRLMLKLGCSSPAELTRYAVREGIAPL